MDRTKELYDYLDNRLKDYLTELKKAEDKLDEISDISSSIVVKKINGTKYYYEQWRQKDGVKSRLLGKVEPGAVYETEIDIQERRNLCDRIKELKFLIDNISKEKDELYKYLLDKSYIYKYSFEVFWKNELSARVSVNNQRVHVSRYIIHPVRQIFSSDNISRNQLNEVLRLRCIEEGRVDIKSKLKAWGLDEYNPLEIVKITHGVSYNDYIWIRFPGEKITAEDVLIR